MKINYNNEDLVSHDGIAAVIKNSAGEILVQEHVKYGFWTIPVGKVKKGQDVVDGLKQEIFEECNISVEEYRELIVKDYCYERNGAEVKVVSHLFEVSKYSGELKNSEPQKHKQQFFMPIKEIIALPYLSDLTLLYLDTIGFHREARLQDAAI